MAILKSQATISCKNIQSLKDVLKPFVNKTLNYIKGSEADMLGLKNKVIRDLQTQDKLTEQKIKSFQKKVETDIEKMRENVQESIDAV